MNTITIKSNNPEDIYFLNELARRLKLEVDIETDEEYQGIGEIKTLQNNDSEKEKILNEIREGFKEVKLAREGKIKLKTLEELLDEYQD